MNKGAFFVVVFAKPLQGKEAAFDDHYQNTHRGYADDIPNVTRIDDYTVVATQDFNVAGFQPYFVSFVEFEDMETMTASMATEAGLALQKDVDNLAEFTGGIRPLVFITEHGFPVPVA